MKKIKNEKGITLVTLTITIVVLMILSFSINVSVKSTMETRNYNYVKEDIINLSEEVKAYYLKNNSLPIDETKTYNLADYGVPSEDINPNDYGNYYRINVSLLENISLNNGGINNNEANEETDDMYVVNEYSLTVYYLKGATFGGQKHYTITDDFAEGGTAKDFYTKVEYPIFPAITLKSNNSQDETVANTGEVVTLKMISKYKQENFIKLPTVKINGEDVSDTLAWNNNIITAKYTIPEDSAKLGYGAQITFEISDYSVKGEENQTINGQTITEVNFGKIVTRKYVTLVQAFKEGNIKVGDYLNYNDYVDDSKTYTTVTNENGWADQTYKATKKTYWQVLGLDSTGTKVMLISQSPIKKEMKTETTAKDWEKSPYLVLKGAYGYIKCKQILNNISMEFEKGKFYTILGVSGSGKTTLLSLLAGLDEPQSGKILYNNQDIREKGYENHRKNNVSLIFQNYNLIDYMTPLENLKIVNPKADKTILNELGLKDDEIKRNVLKLSGGQQQRVAIARTLVANSPVILADEPTGNLDSDTEEEIIEILKTSAHKHGKCVIVVTHSKDLANKSDVILELKDKKLVL